MSRTYLMMRELASRARYEPRTTRDRLKDSVLVEWRHYLRPISGRKILCIWEHIEGDMFDAVMAEGVIPMASGGYCHG